MTNSGSVVFIALLVGLTACGGGGSSGGGGAGDTSVDASSKRLPQWRRDMADNTRINLNLNSQASVDPELSASLNPNFPSSAPWRGATGYAGAFAYGGLNYAPDLGTYGTIVGTVGGHNGYWGNEVVGFDIATRKFSHRSDPYSSNSHPGSFHQNPAQGNQHSDYANGELYINASFTTDQTQPSSFHPYGSNVILPPDAATGVGNNGALVTPIRSARTPTGNNNTLGGSSQRSHIFDLAQSDRATAAWSRFSNNLYAIPTGDFAPTGWAAYDTTRKKMFAGSAGGYWNTLQVLNAVTRQWEMSLSLSDNVWQGDHTLGWHWGANPDYLIVFSGGERGGLGPYFILINVATGTVYTPGTIGTYPKLVGGGSWVESSQKLAFYEGGGTSDEREAGPGFPNRVWILTPPSTKNPAVFTTTPWVWTFEDVTGPPPPVQSNPGNIPHGGRFLWADKVKCFIWWANGVDNVQAWRVRGFF
jgi:hypothetical protein